MGMFDWIFGARRDPQLPEFARQVVAESRVQAWQQISERAGQLGSLPEARAYIRVRARQVVRQQLFRVSDRKTWVSAEREEQILERALVLLAGHFAGSMLRVQPAVAAARRAA
ncbi:MAG: hypothetical protein ACYC4U_21790 [Pirellulaceae bacterium]